MKNILLIIAMAVASAVAAKPFEVEDMHKLLRVGEAQISPDGKWVAFTVARSDVAKNRMVRNLWLVPAAGGDPHELTFLQAMKIPSKLLLFPDEYHWILKPANRVLWYRTVLDWIDQWTTK
jgi:dipeptidyl aminopeptidase/acylaminoacyl peptidase